MKLHAKYSDGEFYPAEVVTVKKKKGEKKPVKVKFTQYPDDAEVWVAMDALKSKKLPKADAAEKPAEPKAKAKAKAKEAKAPAVEEAKGGGKGKVQIGKD